MVNIVPCELAESMVKTSGNFPPEVDEFQSAQLESLPSNRVKPPRVAGTPVQFECQLIQIVQVGSGPLAANLIIGEIVLFHVDERIIDSEGLIDMDKLNAVGRLGGRDYCKTNERFEILPS